MGRYVIYQLPWYSGCSEKTTFALFLIDDHINDQAGTGEGRVELHFGYTKGHKVMVVSLQINVL